MAKPRMARKPRNPKKKIKWSQKRTKGRLIRRYPTVLAARDQQVRVGIDGLSVRDLGGFPLLGPFLQ